MTWDPSRQLIALLQQWNGSGRHRDYIKMSVILSVIAGE
jgi:hypothetical protein